MSYVSGCSVSAVAALMIMATALGPQMANGQQPTAIVEPAVERYVVERGVSYYSDPADDYQRERCVLDASWPTDADGFATVVWFHGGGLTGGERFIPRELQEHGLAVVAPGYRLSPRVKSPVYVEDAAAAVAWAINHVEQHGGRRDRVFVAGHSAGGYLATMVCWDKRWLAAHDLDADKLAGLISYSGQMVTHSTIRGERSIPGSTPVVDDMAPLRHVRADSLPSLLLTGDRDQDIAGRWEANAYCLKMLLVNGHQDCALHELQGFDHGTMVDPGHNLLIEFVRRIGE
ncbi:MAG: lipase [Planctomycetaceae bacterium]|nr:lipase [Planctomycetaceae bacterium]